MARAVVVGGNGFIGSHLVDALAATGYEVTAFDRFSSSAPTYRAPDVRIQRGDFLSRSDLEAAVRGQDLVFHLLSTTTPATAEDDPTLDIRTNLAQSVQLFESAVAAGVQHVYFFSTGGAIYGLQGRSEYAETDRAMPVSPYGIGKLSVEHYLHFFRAKYGLRSTILRISNPYGPRQHPNRRQGLIPIALRQIAEGKPVLRYGDGSMVRDYLFVNDLVAMVIRMLERDSTYDLYNLGSGIGLSVTEIFDAIRSVTARDFEIDERPTPPTFVDRVVLDTRRYREEFGEVPLTPLKDGIALTWAELQQDG